ncbi:MAG: tRNA (adenosine(37)-N6)-threonylcarbamoyltransferase complex dimerization subunit type 1 TsaB [Gemmatimonadales bacterium]
MWLAIETSGDEASVALGREGVVHARAGVSGARRHAALLLPTVERVLEEAGRTLDDIEGVVVSDGPGSFTGLRVGATVAKSLAHDRGWPMRTASALLAQAWHGAGVPDRRKAEPVVLSVSNALRGEVYAAVYRVASRMVTELLAPTVMAPDGLRNTGFAPEIVVTGLDLPAETWPPEARTITGGGGILHAESLIELLAVGNGTRIIENQETWEPEYGRPAEAQARWEAAHGRKLPDSPGAER